MNTAVAVFDGAQRMALAGFDVFVVSIEALPLDAAGRVYLSPFGGVHIGVRRIYVMPAAEIAWWRAGNTWHVVTAYRRGSSFRGISWILLRRARTKREAEAVVRVALGTAGAVDELMVCQPFETQHERETGRTAAMMVRIRYESR